MAAALDLNMGMKTKGDSIEKDKKDIASFLLHIAVTVAAVWVVFTFVFGMMTAPDETMYPRVRNGDLVLFFRLEQTYNVGDVVAIREDGRRYLGRIAAVGGDTVDLSDDGDLIVNGNVQNEEIFYPTLKDEDSSVQYPVELKEDEYFILSDFRTEGADSREYGPVIRSQVKGKVIALLRRRGI